MESQVSALREESIMGSSSTKIRRVQLEEDPGRLIYDTSFYTLIDYNRAGVSLVEIVTEPDFAEPKDVRMFLNKITSIIAHLGVGDTKPRRCGEMRRECFFRRRKKSRDQECWLV